MSNSTDVNDGKLKGISIHKTIKVLQVRLLLLLHNIMKTYSCTEYFFLQQKSAMIQNKLRSVQILWLSFQR